MPGGALACVICPYQYLYHMASDRQKQTRVTGNQERRRTQSRDAITQVGQALQDLGKLTQRLPTGQRQRQARSTTRSSPTASREHITALLDIIKNPQDPNHNRAMEELAQIGSPVIPALSDMLNPQHPWPVAYRAADVLGRIGSGRATGPLIQALRHPNSNVRWSAVHALAQIGDLRALMELRRVAQEDQGKTSWGESIAESAQSVLDQMRTQSMWGQSLELVKTAITSVLMILALILAFSVITTLQSELNRIDNAAAGNVPAVVADANVRTPLPTETLDPTAVPAAAVDPDAAAPEGEGEGAPLPPEPSTTPTSAQSGELTGRVLQAANVRPFPSVNNQPIGSLKLNDQIIFLGRTPDSQWYRIRLEGRSPNATINNPDGSESGWIYYNLVTEPEGNVPIEELASPTPTSVP